MSNIEKVHQFLTKTQTFYVLTTDGDQPKGRPFGSLLLDGGKIYFCCGTFKNVYKQLVANPKVEVLAVDGMDFLRYDGNAAVVKDEAILNQFRERSKVKDIYAENGWERGIFYLENGHAEFRRGMDLVEEFDV